MEAVGSIRFRTRTNDDPMEGDATLGRCTRRDGMTLIGWLVGAGTAMVVTLIALAILAVAVLAIARDEIGLIDCSRRDGVNHRC